MLSSGMMLSSGIITCVNAGSRRPPHTAKEKHPTERTLCFWGGKWGDFIGKSCISLVKGEGGGSGPEKASAGSKVTIF